METYSWETINDEGEEVTEELPASYQVCPRCEGKGKHDHPAFSNGITADEWNGPDWDDYDRSMYLRGGYDVKCSTCDGKRVVLEVDEGALKHQDPALYKRWIAWQEEERDYRSMCESERRMGA